MAVYDVTEEVQSQPAAIQVGDDEQEKQVSNPLVDYVVGRFDEYERQREPLKTKWDNYYRMWRCLPDREDQTEGRAKERSQLKIPATKEAVTNATDNIYQILFPADWFDVQPMPTDLYGLDPNAAAQLLADKTHKATLLKLYHQYLFDRELLVNKLYRFIQDCCLYGTGILRVKVTARTNKQVQRVQQPQFGVDPSTGQQITTGMTEEVRSVEQTVNHAETDCVPIETFYTNLGARGTQANEGCEGCIIQVYDKDFSVAAKFPEIASQLKQQTGKAANGPTGSDQIKADRLSRQGISYQPANNDVELLEYWGFVPNDTLAAAGLPVNEDNLGEEMCVIVANRAILAKFEANPFPSKERPFLKFCFEEVNNEFYGLGIAEVADGPQRALNAMFRARLDNMALSLNNMFGINFDKMIPGQTLDTYAGKCFLFHGDPKDALFPISVPDVTANIYRDTEAMRQVIQSAHGVSPMLGGQAAKGGEQTATEVSMLMSQSTSKIKTIVGRFERTIIKPLLQWYTRLTLQYLDEQEVFALFDPATGQISFKTISPEDVAQDYEFIPRGVIKMQQANEASKYAQALQMSANPMDAQVVNRRYLWQKFYEALGLNDLQAAVLTTPPQPQPMMPGMPGQQLPGQPSVNPNVTGGQVNPQPMTNSAEQPGAILSQPATPGALPQG